MKIKNYLLLALLSISILSACKKDRGIEIPPSVVLNIAGTAINGGVNQEIVFTATPSNGSYYTQEWKIGTEVKSTEGTFKFTPAKAGVYTIEFHAVNKFGVFDHTYTLTVEVPVIPVTPGSNEYVNKLYEYSPAAGQFMNKGFGDQASAESIVGKKGSGVSLGAFGGYIVLGFDHTVINQTDKEDIIIYNNAFANFSEPGVVWVMQDENGNGKPDDTWYELAGSEVGKSGYVRNYAVTYIRPTPPTLSVSWKDNLGNTGVVKQSFHKQAHYPLWITADEFTRTGTLLPSTGIKGSASAALESGYSDNKPGSDKFDIANAIDKDGKKVVLKGIDFIKVQTGIMADLGPFGELSTEVMGIADLSLVK